MSLDQIIAVAAIAVPLIGILFQQARNTARSNDILSALHKKVDSIITMSDHLEKLHLNPGNLCPWADATVRRGILEDIARANSKV